MDKAEWIEIVGEDGLADDGLELDGDVVPIETTDYQFGVFKLVGHGSQTSEDCGRFRFHMGCIRVELHDRVSLDGQDFRGKMFGKAIFNSCDKPSCPQCFKFGWAVRGAFEIKHRLFEASKGWVEVKDGREVNHVGLGQVEHIIASVPPKLYGLSLEALRRKVEDILVHRGVVGGCIIFHAFRYNQRHFWYFSPHFHALGFIEGGYRCRGCKKCFRCGGFVNRQYEAYKKDGWICKVKGKRKTVGGTAWYILNHASYDVSKRRFHVWTWFGVVSYRKMRIEKAEREKALCPICKHELERLRYVGHQSRIFDFYYMVRDPKNKVKLDFYADFEDERGLCWIPDRRGSGSYEG